MVTYFPAAQQMHWPPFENNDSHRSADSNGSSLTITDTSSSPETTETAPASDPPTSHTTTDQTTTTAQPTDSAVPGLTDAERDLLSRIRPGVLTACQVERADETGAIVAAFSCQPTQGGPAANIDVEEYANSSAVQQAMSQLQEMSPAGDQTTEINDCGSGQYSGPWYWNGYMIGKMVCQIQMLGPLGVEWSFVSPPVMVDAVGSAGPSGLFSWWQYNAYCVNTN